MITKQLRQSNRNYMFSHICYACFVCILAWTSLLYLQLDKFDIREQVFITVKSTILVFKVLFQVSWTFNFSIETISNSLKPNYWVALIKLYHRMHKATCLVFLSVYFKYMQNDSVSLLSVWIIYSWITVCHNKSWIIICHNRR